MSAKIEGALVHHDGRPASWVPPTL